MSGWNGMSFEGKETMLGVVRREAGQFFEMVDSDDVWEAPTGAGHWQVRDVVAHITDTTEAYFVAFDAARADRSCRRRTGCRGWLRGWTQQALALRIGAADRVGRAAAYGLRQDDGDLRRAGPGGVDRVQRPALLHGSAAGVLLPGVPADGLRRPLLGHPAGDRPGPRALGRGGGSPRPVHVRAVEVHDRRQGSVRARHPDHQRPERRRHPGASARTAWTTSPGTRPDCRRSSSSTRAASC